MAERAQHTTYEKKDFLLQIQHSNFWISQPEKRSFFPKEKSQNNKICMLQRMSQSDNQKTRKKKTRFLFFFLAPHALKQ
jgi:hypothetical protein